MQLLFYAEVTQTANKQSNEYAKVHNFIEIVRRVTLVQIFHSTQVNKNNVYFLREISEKKTKLKNATRKIKTYGNNPELLACISAP